jgi:hypothetical protein
MPGTRVELAEIVLPEFGLPREEPTIPEATYETRIATARQHASDAGYDVLMVYADRDTSPTWRISQGSIRASKKHY